MKYYRYILMTLILSLSACATTQPLREIDLEFEGYWGEDIADCSTNPHSIQFSKSGEFMHIKYPKTGGTADNKSIQNEFVYRVLGTNPDGLHLSLDGESRLNESGLAVTWDIRKISATSYCWRRSDWGSDSCTVPRTRCGSN